MCEVDERWRGSHEVEKDAETKMNLIRRGRGLVDKCWAWPRDVGAKSVIVGTGRRVAEKRRGGCMMMV